MLRIFPSLGSILLPALILFAGPARAETAASSKAATKAEPQTIVDDAGRFVATFPGKVQRDSQSVDTAVGKVQMNMVYNDAGAIAYMVIFSDYPAGSVTQSGGPEKVCQNASNGAVQSKNGKVRTSSACQLGDVSGLDVTADIPPASDTSNDTMFLHARFFVVGDRLYQVLYVSPTGKETTSAATAFFDSFRLTH